MTYQYLPQQEQRCRGFTCPHDRDQCKRFTERNVYESASYVPPYAEAVISLDGARSCASILPVKAAA